MIYDRSAMLDLLDDPARTAASHLVHGPGAWSP